MTDKRRIDIPVFPYLVLILGLVIMLASGLIYANFPSEGKIAVGTLAGGIMVAALAFLLRPAMFQELVKNRKTLLWVNDIALVLIIIGIGVVLAHIGFRRNIRYDFTRNGMFSVSDQTIKTVRNLKKDVKITAFYPKNTREEQMVKELLEEYKRHSDRLKVSFVDPFRDPMTVKAMNVGSPGTVVVQCETSRQDIMGTDIFERPSPYAGPDAKPKFKGEQVFTSALINVTSGIKRRIDFVTGHGEASISGYTGRDVAGLNELLIRENYEVEEINLIEEEIASATNLVAIISPQRDFLDSELDKIRTFIKGRHGHLIVALDPLSETGNLEKFLLSEFGLMVNKDVVVDPRGLQRQYWTVAPELTPHPALNPLKEANLISIMFHCRSLNVESKDGYSAVDYLNTIDSSWAKRGIKSGGQLQIGFEEGKDARGPFKLAVLLEDTTVASGSKILVFGDSDFVSNSYIGFGGNKDLFINSVNYMVGQEQMIAIRAKVVEIPEVVLDQNSANRIFTICVIVSPLLIVLAGAVVFLYRRRV
ncbi:MAG: gliding motility-associatede transport system auxiliary component [Clostridiales bacterium]|nr:gliding motility-associatede transport system auxiliary component [Clostridiales bacterium]MDN5283037.1 gliding motility-associatede transport system auxiliary component [Candidatus Ozemobacter sp.]